MRRGSDLTDYHGEEWQNPCFQLSKNCIFGYPTTRHLDLMPRALYTIIDT